MPLGTRTSELVPGRLACDAFCCLSLDCCGKLRDCWKACARLRVAMWVLRCAVASAAALLAGLPGQLLEDATATGMATADGVLVHPGVRLREEPQAEMAELVLHKVVGVVILVCGMNVVFDGVALL